MRAEQIERLKTETQIIVNELEKLERDIEKFEREIKQSKEIRRLARLIVSEKIKKILLTKKIGKEKNYVADEF